MMCWKTWIGTLALLAAITATAAGAPTLTIADTSISATQARDGALVTLGYRITSDAAATARLSPYLSGYSTTPGLADAVDIDVTAGTNWYYRQFRINMPPGATMGSSAYYSVVYRVTWGSSQSTSVTKTNLLNVPSPIPVRVPILMYHKIGDALYSQYWITRQMLAGQLAALQAYGYTPITCRQLMDIRAGLAAAPAKPIMLTFDGGYQNFYQKAVPVLETYDYPAVMFLLTGVMGQDNSWDGDNNPVIMFMTWEEVTAANNTGLVDLESHSVTHPDFTAISAATRQQELLDSRADIEERYGCPVDFFCYPYGSYNTTVKNAVFQAGYHGAFAAWGGVEGTSADKYALKRVPVYWDSSLDYDPAKPSSFFFKQIGDSLPIPNVSVTSIEFLDPVTGQSVAGQQIGWGQTVIVRATVANTAATANAVATLVFDTNTDPMDGAFFDSHSSPQAPDDVSLYSWTGSRTIEWVWTAPVGAPSGACYSSIRFKDPLYVLGFHKSSPIAAFSIYSTDTALPQTKMEQDTQLVAVQDAFVTATGSEFFYIETGSRASGVRVEKQEHGMSEGRRADVAGRTGVTPSGERCIYGTYARDRGAGAVSPLSMKASSLGGSSFGLQQGLWTLDAEEHVVPSTGLSNVGLLVSVTGRVSAVDPGERTCLLDDGSGELLQCSWRGDLSIDPGWTFLTLTGISSCRTEGGKLRPLLLVTGVAAAF